MNIRPIDLQVLIPQANEVGKTQHIANQHNSAQQQDFASQWQQISQTRQRQVQTINHADGGKVARKQDQQQKRRKQDESSEQRRKNENHDSSAKCSPQQVQPACGLGSTIDIKT